MKEKEGIEKVDARAVGTRGPFARETERARATRSRFARNHRANSEARERALFVHRRNVSQHRNERERKRDGAVSTGELSGDDRVYNRRRVDVCRSRACIIY